MNAKLVVMSVAVIAGLVAGCDRSSNVAEKSTAQMQQTPTATPAPQISSTAVTTKGNMPPIQGQVDTREPAQRRDFETKKP